MAFQYGYYNTLCGLMISNVNFLSSVLWTRLVNHLMCTLDSFAFELKTDVFQFPVFV
jgi:hypothetical protein